MWSVSFTLVDHHSACQVVNDMQVLPSHPAGPSMQKTPTKQPAAKKQATNHRGSSTCVGQRAPVLVDDHHQCFH